MSISSENCAKTEACWQKSIYPYLWVSLCLATLIELVHPRLQITASTVYQMYVQRKNTFTPIVHEPPISCSRYPHTLLIFWFIYTEPILCLPCDFLCTVDLDLANTSTGKCRESLRENQNIVDLFYVLVIVSSWLQNIVQLQWITLTGTSSSNCTWRTWFSLAARTNVFAIEFIVFTDFAT